MTSQQEAIMVVDDELDILSVIMMSLERSGMKVHGFDNPVAALEHIDKEGMPWLLDATVWRQDASNVWIWTCEKDKAAASRLRRLADVSIWNKQGWIWQGVASDQGWWFIPKPAKLSLLVETIKRYESIRQKT
jgi:DNA-binding NtrC family response regulator